MSVTADLVVMDVAFRNLCNVELPSDAEHLRTRVHHAEADRRRQLHLCGLGFESDDESPLCHQAEQAADDQVLGAVLSFAWQDVVAVSSTKSACLKKCGIVRISFNITKAGRKTVRFVSLTHPQPSSTC